MDRVDDFGGLQFVLKNNRSSQQWRQEHTQELAKHMAQRQQIQKPQRMHPALVLQIALHLALQRRDVCQNIAVRDDHALGIGGRPRGKHNLQDVIVPERNFSRRKFRTTHSVARSPRSSMPEPQSRRAFLSCPEIRRKAWPGPVRQPGLRNQPRPHRPSEPRPLRSPHIRKKPPPIPPNSRPTASRDRLFEFRGHAFRPRKPGPLGCDCSEASPLTAAVSASCFCWASLAKRWVSVSTSFYWHTPLVLMHLRQNTMLHHAYAQRVVRFQCTVLVTQENPRKSKSK